MLRILPIVDHYGDIKTQQQIDRIEKAFSSNNQNEIHATIICSPRQYIKGHILYNAALTNNVNAFSLIKDYWNEYNDLLLNLIDRGNDTLLHIAARDSLDVLKWLLDNSKIDINVTNNEGSSPLHCAYRQDICQLLVEKGANPHALNNCNKKPYQTCYKDEYPETYAYLKNLCDIMPDPSIVAIEENLKTPAGELPILDDVKVAGDNFAINTDTFDL